MRDFRLVCFDGTKRHRWHSLRARVLSMNAGDGVWRQNRMSVGGTGRSSRFATRDCVKTPRKVPRTGAFPAAQDHLCKALEALRGRPLRAVISVCNCSRRLRGTSSSGSPRAGLRVFVRFVGGATCPLVLIDGDLPVQSARDTDLVVAVAESARLQGALSRLGRLRGNRVDCRLCCRDQCCAHPERDGPLALAHRRRPTKLELFGGAHALWPRRPGGFSIAKCAIVWPVWRCCG